jgi:hypothetical protein
LDEKTKNQNKNQTTQKEEIKYGKYSTKSIKYTEEVDKKNSIKSFKSLDANKRSYKYYAKKRHDKIKLRKLEIKLKEETKLRKYYQKLYNELNTKNKNLCVQLLNKSLTTNNIEDNENEAEQESANIMNDIKLNKELINNINIKRGVAGMNINKRSLSMGLGFKKKNTDGVKKRRHGSTISNKIEYEKSKSKKIKRIKYLLNGGKIDSNNDSPKNKRKKYIMKKGNTNENNIIKRNDYNFNITNIINSKLKKKNTVCVNKIKPREIKSILSPSNKSDNSQSLLYKFKLVESKEYDTDDSPKKKSEFIDIKSFKERNKTKD